MRGRPHENRKTQIPHRNTPAYAGKTGARLPALSMSRKHPRVCGEDGFSVGDTANITETPPRMRGRLKAFSKNHVYMRNTPAYAGKTAQQAAHSDDLRKHPRVCGEDLTFSRMEP